MNTPNISMFPGGWTAQRILDQLTMLERIAEQELPNPAQLGIPLSRSGSRAFAEALVLSTDVGVANEQMRNNPAGALFFLSLARDRTRTLSEIRLDVLPESPARVGIFDDVCLWYLVHLDNCEQHWLQECLDDDTYGLDDRPSMRE